MKTRKLSFVFTLAAVAVAWFSMVPSAMAGAKYTYPLLTQQFNGNTYVYGSFTDARNSPDTFSFIACGITAYPGQPVSGECNVYMPNQSWYYCGTTDPGLIQAIIAMKADSIISFEILGGGTSGVCGEITSITTSYIAPKTP